MQYHAVPRTAPQRIQAVPTQCAVSAMVDTFCSSFTAMNEHLSDAFRWLLPADMTTTLQLESVQINGVAREAILNCKGKFIVDKDKRCT